MFFNKNSDDHSDIWCYSRHTIEGLFPLVSQFEELLTIIHLIKLLILISDKQIKLAQVSNNIPFPWFEDCFLSKFLTSLQLRALFLMYQLRIKPPYNQH